LSLIITCARHFESDAIDEIKSILADFGDTNSEIIKSNLSGILTVKTQLDLIEVIERLRKKIIDEPWSVRYCLRIIPIQEMVQTNLNRITKSVLKKTDVIKPDDRYRITIENRNSSMNSAEIINDIASKIPNKVSLEKHEWIILIEILGNITGIGILKNNSILSVEKIKRSFSD